MYQPAPRGGAQRDTKREVCEVFRLSRSLALTTPESGWQSGCCGDRHSLDQSTGCLALSTTSSATSTPAVPPDRRRAAPRAPRPCSPRPVNTTAARACCRWARTRRRHHGRAAHLKPQPRDTDQPARGGSGGWEDLVVCCVVHFEERDNVLERPHR